MKEALCSCDISSASLRTTVLSGKEDILIKNIAWPKGYGLMADLLRTGSPTFAKVSILVKPSSTITY